MSQKHERRSRVAAELEKLDFGDPRRAARGQLIAERLAHQPKASLPVAMRDDAELEGAYRHLTSPAVTLGNVVAPHVEQTRQRVREAGGAYVVHDTTDFTFGGEAGRAGLGPVQGGDQGFLAHLSLAVSADGQRMPLGLLAVGTRVRGEAGQRTVNERDKWALGMAHASQGLEADSLIQLADREGDVYEVLSWLMQGQQRFIVRAAQDRVVLENLEPEEKSRLFAVAQAAPALLEVEVQLGPRAHKGRSAKDVRRHPVRRTRKARLAYSATRVQLKRPAKASKELPAYQSVNVVRAWEVQPPEGQQPVEWILLTSEPIDTPQQVQKVVEGYRTRWCVEEYIKAVKTGCAYEESQLESAHALFNLLGYCLIVAYALLLLRAQSRARQPLPAEHFFTPAQLACLRALSRGALPAAPSVQDALLACARLGGHLRRNGLPGWHTLSIGYSRLLDYEQGFLAAQRLQGSISDQS